MRTRPVLGIQESLEAVDAVVAAAAAKPGRPVAAIVVDHHGDIIAFLCESGANPALARQNAYKKAYTSACMRVNSSDFGERRKSQGPVREQMHPNFTEGGGGLVIIAQDGTILGGLGVSGRPSDVDDTELAEAGLQALTAAIARREKDSAR
jgi:glc operon protein GlcG